MFIVIAFIMINIVYNFSYKKTDVDLEKNDNEKFEQIKNELGFQGDDSIYEIKNEDENLDILVIKPSVSFQVAYSGMINNSVKSFKEAEEIINNNFIDNNGIYILEDSREKFLSFLKSDLFKNSYYIDENGYLKLEDKADETKYDEILLNQINSNKKIIISISSTCYIVDNITGEILDYNFEEMDKYQPYEYFNDNDRTIIFVTENKETLLKNDEIIKSIILCIEGL